MKTNYNILFQTKNYIKLYDDDYPEIVHLIESGFKDTWFKLLEDPYSLEPWQTGIITMNSETILNTYGINVKVPNQYIEEQLSKIHSHAEIVNDENPDEVVYREADILNLFKKIL